VDRCELVSMSTFLKDREEIFMPDDKDIKAYKRLTKIDFLGNIHLSDKKSKTKMIKIQPDDLVISGINVSKGAVVIYDGEQPITATIHYSSYKINISKIDIEYLKRFLKSLTFIELLKKQVKGGIKTEIKPKHLLPLMINLPCMEKQKKIVSYFESVEREVCELAEEIILQDVYFKNLKKTILKDAFEGKLTADWREQNPNLNGDNNDVLKMFGIIKAEKEQLSSEGKIRRPKKLQNIDLDELSYDIPKSWLLLRLGDVIMDLPRNGYSPKGVDYKTKVKNLKLGATTYGVFNPYQYKYIDEKIDDDSTYWLEDGDILIQRGNSIDYVGVSAIYRGNSKEFIYPDLMMKINPVKCFDAKLMHMFLSSSHVRDYFRNNAKGAQETMPKINQGVVLNAVVPLVPVDEQIEIINRVEKLMQIVNELEEHSFERKTQVKVLNSVISKEAFERGE